MLKKILILLILTIPLNLQAAESNKGSMPKHKWSFNGITGTFDRAALQRGFKVNSRDIKKKLKANDLFNHLRVIIIIISE